MSIDNSPARAEKSAGPVLSQVDQRRTLTIAEAASALGIGRNKAYEAARAGQIPVIRIGKRLLVPRTALARLLSEGSAS